MKTKILFILNLLGWAVYIYSIVMSIKTGEYKEYTKVEYAAMSAMGMIVMAESIDTILMIRREKKQ